MMLLDDVCNFPQGTDQKFLGKIREVYCSHAHFSSTGGDEFVIKHYAGDVCSQSRLIYPILISSSQVHYNVDGFCDKNKDLLFKDLVGLAEVTSIPFIQVSTSLLFREGQIPHQLANRACSLKPRKSWPLRRSQLRQASRSRNLFRSLWPLFLVANRITSVASSRMTRRRPTVSTMN